MLWILHESVINKPREGKMSELRTVSQIDAEIAQAQAELKNVRGTETEVYARIVGYYRSVRNWNKGKRDEYDLRKQFVWDSGEDVASNYKTSITPEVETSKSEISIASEKTAVVSGEVYYEYFSRKTCPNCKPVQKHLETVEITGIHVDVDTPEGLESASKLGVLSAPTVILFDSTGNEIARAHNITELKQIFSVKCECVA